MIRKDLIFDFIHLKCVNDLILWFESLRLIWFDHFYDSEGSDLCFIDLKCFNELILWFQSLKMIWFDNFYDLEGPEMTKCLLQGCRSAFLRGGHHRHEQRRPSIHLKRRTVDQWPGLLNHWIGPSR